MYELVNDKDQSIFQIKTKDELDKKEYWFNWIYANTRAQVNYSNEWRLPTTQELEVMYKELHLKNLGDFEAESYWSIDEDPETMANARSFNMSKGTIFPRKKSGLLRVRYVKTLKAGIPSESESKADAPKSKGCLALLAMLAILGSALLIVI